MNAYAILEFVVIGLIVGLSADRVLRQLAPASHRALRRWIAVRLGLKPADAENPAGGCSSGCGSCGTGCSTGPANHQATQPEQPLNFRPRKV